MTAPANQVFINGQAQVSGDNLNSFVQYCDTAADLRNFIGIDTMTVYLQGTTAPADGGQGNFYWSATGTAPDDNGVTVVVPNGSTTGEWVRIGSAGVNLPTLNVTGNATIGGTLAVTEAATLSSSLAVTGNETVGGTLGVTGNTTLGGTLALTGAATLLAGGTSTTPAVGDMTTKIATAGFANPGFLSGQPGFQKFPSGLVFMWGLSPSVTTGSNVIITVPVTTTNLQTAWATPVATNAAGGWAINFSGATTFTIYNNTGQTSTFLWGAVGM